MDVLGLFTPIPGHVAGIPVEETLPGLLAVGAVSVRLGTEWLRRRLHWRSTEENGAERGSRPE